MRLLAVIIGLLLSPSLCWAGVAADTLRGVGMPIVQLMVLCTFSWIMQYITSALGYGQVAGMVKIITIFTAIAMVIGTVWSAIAKVSGFFGLAL